MPSVGMRRTTRVFGARVLRSGRRLWTGPPVGKRMRAADAEDWIDLLDNSGVNGGDTTTCKENGWHDDVSLKHGTTEMDIDLKIVEPGSKRSAISSLVNEKCVDKMWGSVYQRKRRKVDLKDSAFSANSNEGRPFVKRRYGKQFCRKEWRKRRQLWQEPSEVCVIQQVLVIVVKSHRNGNSWLACFLNSVLEYMRRARVCLPHLSAFVLSEPFAHAYSSYGIHFLRDSASIQGPGICKIFGARSVIPLFTTDFTAVPFCFMFLHSSFHIRSAYMHYLLMLYPKDVDVVDGELTDDEELPLGMPLDGNEILLFGTNNPGKNRVVIETVASPKLNRRTRKLRSNLTSHGFQKRRSSLRVRRGRGSSVLGIRRGNGALVSDLTNLRHDRFSPVASTRELRSATRVNSMPSAKELKSTTLELAQDMDSTSCSANILVIDSDKCYREEGATVNLEMSTSKQWVLAVKRNGTNRYCLEAQKVMKPCSINRITRAKIWAGESSWKLEFPDKQDWTIFKELYKECSVRSMQDPAVSFIPVPGVTEVSGYAESCTVPFIRPPSYITLKDDEVARALAKRTANYDMDSDDEGWLNRYNIEHDADDEFHKHVTAESFELIIDAFEKGFYCNPEDYTDEKIAVNYCLALETKGVLEDVCSYWMRKRKQKRSVLLRVFQCNQHRRPQLIPKTVLRKKRSFKRQASQAGRGKQRTFLQAMAAEQSVLEEQNAIRRVEEAKAAAGRSDEVAILKRQRAQALMDVADLTTYKATMALRIAEAAAESSGVDAMASLFLN